MMKVRMTKFAFETNIAKLKARHSWVHGMKMKQDLLCTFDQNLDLRLDEWRFTKEPNWEYQSWKYESHLFLFFDKSLIVALILSFRYAQVSPIRDTEKCKASWKHVERHLINDLKKGIAGNSYYASTFSPNVMWLSSPLCTDCGPLAFPCYCIWS